MKKKISTLCLLLASGLLWLPMAFGRLTMPTVDLAPNNIAGRNTDIVIWSSTSRSLSAETYLAIQLPEDFIVPSFNPYTCTCVFMKHSICSPCAATCDQESTEFTKKEVPVLSVTMSAQTIWLATPAAMAKGKFYIRLDRGTGIKLSGITGTATLHLVEVGELQNVTVTSHGFYIGPSYTAASYPEGNIHGIVYGPNPVTWLPEAPFPGAMVFAWGVTCGSRAHPVTAGPRATGFLPLSTCAGIYTTVSKTDGSYSIPVRPDGYRLQAAFNGVTDTAWICLSSTVATVNVTGAAQVEKDLTLTAAP